MNEENFEEEDFDGISLEGTVAGKTKEEQEAIIEALFKEGFTFTASVLLEYFDGHTLVDWLRVIDIGRAIALDDERTEEINTGIKRENALKGDLHLASIHILAFSGKDIRRNITLDESMEHYALLIPLIKAQRGVNTLMYEAMDEGFGESALYASPAYFKNNKCSRWSIDGMDFEGTEKGMKRLKEIIKEQNGIEDEEE